MKAIFLSFLLSLVLFSCKSQSKKKNKKDPEPTPAVAVNAPVDYDLLHPLKKWTLPKELFEISGQSWIDENHLLAVEDFHPTLYLLRLDDNLQVEKTITFGDSSGKKFDLEDVAVIGPDAYALWSQGKVYKIANWNGKIAVTKYKTGLDKANNTEGLCFDPVGGNLLVACKNESDIADEKKSTRSIFEFDLKGDSLKTEPFLLIHTDELMKMSSEKLLFFPSAIAIHPITHDIYVLSTRDTKCMARYKHSGELISLQFFDKDLFPQPEGICFAPDGTMYVSSEGKHGEQAVIYSFKHLK
ncbi:MAG TPA: SdiA-regulated domain-containing protein [Chitinophagaceae bacterium]|nr:SdiA-regulated domain-containing protein [Chitinophagaceae bacterium]